MSLIKCECGEILYSYGNKVWCGTCENEYNVYDLAADALYYKKYLKTIICAEGASAAFLISMAKEALGDNE